MLILAVDDENKVLGHLGECLHDVIKEHKIVLFSSSNKALRFAQNNKIDIAFLDVLMPEINGIELAQLLKETNPDIKLVIVSASRDYAFEAFEINASGYILKPVSKESIIRETSKLILPNDKDIKIVCFGNFEIFYKDRPMHFTRKKEKELIAYLVNQNGASCSNNQIMSELWEDDKDHSVYFYKIRQALKNDLHKMKCDDLITFNKGSCSINRNVADCDYFNYKDNKPGALDTYAGEYMSQYPWADITNGTLYSNKYF